MIVHISRKKYTILPEYISVILPTLTWMLGLIMNLIIGIHHSCERKEHEINILQVNGSKGGMHSGKGQPQPNCLSMYPLFAVNYTFCYEYPTLGYNFKHLSSPFAWFSQFFFKASLYFCLSSSWVSLLGSGNLKRPNRQRDHGKQKRRN